MFYLNFWMALLGSLLFPWIWIGSRLFAMRAFSASYEKRERGAAILRGVEENVHAQAVVKAFGLQEQASRDFEERNARWLPSAFRVNFLSALVERWAYM